MNKHDPVGDLFQTEAFDGSATEIMHLLGKYGIRNLAYDGDPGRNPGYIFRGEADFPQPLQSSIERKLRKELGDNESINGAQLLKREKELITNFVRGDGRHVAAILDKQGMQKRSEPESSVFYWLSVMQHYSDKLSSPTRFIDFTRDIRFALFFAIQQVEDDEKAHARRSDDLIIYCFPCKDLKHPQDLDNNKCPFRFGPNLEHIDMHLAIGCLIGLPWMPQPSNQRFKTHLQNRSGQRWGWDLPYLQNARLEFQKGMFVYPFDCPECPLQRDEGSWFVQNLRHKSGDPFNLGSSAEDLPAMRIRIAAENPSKLKEYLAGVYHLTEATVYVDYSRVKC